MRDFEPDYFSVSPKNYSSVPFKKSREIENLIKEQFPTVERILDVQNLSGLDINSGNFKIKSETGNYVLKQWNSKDLIRINQICQILLHLSHEGISSPVPITNLKSQFIAQDNRFNFSLFRYLDGEIFQPKFSDMQSYFASISSLFTSLGKYKNSSANHNLQPNPRLISQTLMKSVTNDLSELVVKFPDDFGKLKKIIRNLLNDLERYALIMDDHEKQFSHYDLHPRNILKQKKSHYAFLDFESCNILDPNLAWGFTLLKILRQVMVGSKVGLDPIAVGKKSLDLIGNQDFASNLNIPLLPVFGRVEIMRRLAYIIDEFENFKSETWLSMLSIQVQILNESYILFPPKMKNR